MVNKKNAAILVAIILALGLAFSLTEIFAASDPYPAGPIFDGSVDPSLHLSSCRGEDKDLAKYFSDKESKELQKYKTRGFKKIQEEWRGKSGSVTIERYYFDCHEDAVAMANHPFIIGFNAPWYGWSGKKDIGDRTSWMGPDLVIFVKGKVLVRLYLNSALLTNEEQKVYTRKVAESVEKKL